MALNAIVQPQKLAAVAAEVIEQSLVLPALFQREGFENFRGAENDTVYTRVPGILPAHEIANFRAERTSSITFDAFVERKISLTLSGNTYSATKLQDEQKDWDSIQWARVITTQAEAVARSLEDKAVDLVTGQSYLATIAGTGVTNRTMRQALLKLRAVANRFKMPLERRNFVIGTAIEEAILGDDKLVLAQNVGDQIAATALREATIGRLFGMNVVVSQEIDPDKGYLFVPSAFAMATAAPAVPQSATGGSAAARGIGARWVLDYDPTILAERSVVNTYNGVRSIKDVMLNADRSDVIRVGETVGEFLIRAIAFDLDATADALPNADANADADGTGGTPGAATLLNQFVSAVGVGTPYTP
ncbi:hypothetical protein [Plantactinospora sp. WMMB782]|uniref:hypothetical protein n=1 Tax=Plantactinospora sp. WMMB782 TaxID=3404121 RepID=UPI003B932C70